MAMTIHGVNGQSYEAATIINYDSRVVGNVDNFIVSVTLKS